VNCSSAKENLVKAVKKLYLLLSPAKGGVVQMEKQTENDACSVKEKPGQQQASPPPAHISCLPLAAEKVTKKGLCHELKFK
jgi:hypothetical protein